MPLYVRNLAGQEKQAYWTENTDFSTREVVCQGQLTEEVFNNVGDCAKFQINNRWVWVTHCSLDYSKNQNKHFGNSYIICPKHFSPLGNCSFISCILFLWLQNSFLDEATSLGGGAERVECCYTILCFNFNHLQSSLFFFFFNKF